MGSPKLYYSLHPRLNILWTFGLKFFKSPPLNPLIQSFPTIPRACSNSSIILSFDLNGFSMKNNFQYSITSLLLHHRVKHYETKPNQLGAPPTHQGLFNDIKNVTRGAVVWERSQRDDQTKQTNKL
jgi:hypothetical protein